MRASGLGSAELEGGAALVERGGVEEHEHEHVFDYVYVVEDVLVLVSLTLTPARCPPARHPVEA
jgi:hypothetical protein